jgi:hypothetical protein
MANFAKIDKNTKEILNVIMIDNNVLTDNGSLSEENEQLGLDFIKQLYPDADNFIWKQTSYNDNFRGKFAGIGGLYDEDIDAFVPPKPFFSWILNIETLLWEPPISKPEITESQLSEGSYYEWSDDLYQSDHTKGWIFKS